MLAAAGASQRWLRISSWWRPSRGGHRGSQGWLALLCRQKVSGSGMAGTVLPLCLLLAAALRDALTQAPGHGARPGPPLLRLRRLEEQVGARVGEGVQPGPCQGGIRRFGPGSGLAAPQGPGTGV